jgi:hypothetical protein
LVEEARFPDGTNLFLYLERIKSYINGMFRPFAGALAKLRKANFGFVMSVRPHATTPIPLAGLQRNLKFEDFSEIYPENSVSLKFDKNNRYI